MRILVHGLDNVMCQFSFQRDYDAGRMALQIILKF
jgi:hypothetical protein